MAYTNYIFGNSCLLAGYDVVYIFLEPQNVLRATRLAPYYTCILPVRQSPGAVAVAFVQGILSK